MLEQAIFLRNILMQQLCTSVVFLGDLFAKDKAAGAQKVYLMQHVFWIRKLLRASLQYVVLFVMCSNSSRLMLLLAKGKEDG